MIDRITLEGKLLFGTAVVGLLTLILTANALIPTYEGYRSAQDNLHAVERFRLVLEAAGRISAERGPANDIMSIEPDSSLAAKERLEAFRRGSDLALAALDAPIDRGIGRNAMAELNYALSRTREQLKQAREAVDHVATVPLPLRGQEDVQNAIGKMIGVFDVFQDVVDWHVATFTVRRPELTAPFLTGRMISALREYGGRIASQIMGPVATRRPLEDSHLAESSQTMGKLLELRLLLHGQRIMSDGDPLAAQLMQEVDTTFFGTGLGLVKTLISEGRESGDYSISAVELTRRYVPTLRSLEKLRAVFLDEIVKTYRLQQQAAFHDLVKIAAITLSVLVVLLLLVRLIRIRVFHPLLTARRQIIGLADGYPMAGPSATSNVPELRRLFEAVELLQTKLAERTEYEERLRMLAERDGLTGVWNRRALEEFGSSRTFDDDTCLMLIDIDHFKVINDTYGHLVGDAVLIEVAALLQKFMRPCDMVARFGGEEFAVLVSDSDLATTADLAENLRALIQCCVFQQENTDAEVKITVSIGVAQAGHGSDKWRQLIAAADEALYSAKNGGRDRVCVSEGETDHVAELSYRRQGFGTRT